VSFLQRISECNRFDPAGFRPLRLGAAVVGRVRPEAAAALGEFPEVFRPSPDGIELGPVPGGAEACTAAVARVMRTLHAAGVIRGWRDELYPVATRHRGEPLFLVERAAVPFLGVRACGVHANGWVRAPEGLRMWVARRARDKPTYPGKLDNMVAGGLPHGVTARRHLIRECGEEAGVPPALAGGAVSAGAIRYCTEATEGLKPDLQLVYDLEVPPDFEPRPVDGEVEGFELWPMERVMQTVRDTTDFKLNCNLVIIDFLVRRGFIGPEHPEFLEIVERLHCPPGEE